MSDLPQRPPRPPMPRQPKLQLSLDDRRRAKLQRIADRENVSLARVIRRLIDEAVEVVVDEAAV